MRWLSRFGPKASSAVLFFATQGVFAGPVPSPNLDLSALGQVALAGDFDAISVYSYEGQREGSSGNGTQSVLAQMPNGYYDVLSSTDASIEAMCPFVLKDGTLAGIVVGGNFTSIGGVNSRSVALLDPNTAKITPLPGIQGSVSALLCDQDTETVYVGGSFEAANSSNAIAWIAAGAWANLPFAGFDAPVSTIQKAPNGHVVFGGSFSGLGNTSLSTTAQNNRATQVINLSSANVTSEGTTPSASFADPKTIVCPSNETDTFSSAWLLKDKTPGSWSASFGFGFEPTKLRLWNTKEQGCGTKTWRFTALPIGGIMNMTYTNSTTGQDMYCDSQCSLDHTSTFQEFTFVNTVGMNAFRIDISDWYGNGGGLAGIELLQSDIFSYAVEAFNEPSCTANGTVSRATATGPWYTTPSRSSVADYLSVVVGSANMESTSIVFEPEIQSSGNYSVLVYTPGCIQDSSCSARAVVNVTGTLTTSGQQSFSTQISQTNNYEKYDTVFQGHIDQTTTGFRPSVTITASGLQESQLFVASRVGFGYISTTGGLNGLFDYDPNKAVVDTNFSASAINTAGNLLHPNAHVTTLVTHDQTIYAAGSFSDHLFENIMAFHANNATSLPHGGLNAAVMSMYSLDDFLYVGGNFTDTSSASNPGLSNVGAYQYSKNTWVALGAGLNGPVASVVPMQLNITQGTPETVIAFTGDFSQVKSSGSASSHEANGFAIWIPSHSSWLADLDITKQALSGNLNAATFLPNNTWFGAGTLASSGIGVSGAVGMESPSGAVSLQSLPVDISPSNSQSSLAKRALTGQQAVTGVATGIYYNNGGRNVTVLGGHFSASSTNGSTIENLLFLNGSHENTVTGPPSGLDSNSTFLALALQGDILFAGGSVSGLVNTAQVEGLVLYDLQRAEYRTIQPAALAGDNVIVNAIATQPSSTAVYVGGSFDQTSQDLSCTSVCMYDTGMNQWNTVGSGLSGTVTALYWTSDTIMIAAGNLSVSGNTTSLATYDSKHQIWSVMQTSAVPGPVTAFAPARQDASRMWVAGTASNGSTYLAEVDSSGTKPVVNMLGHGTIIRGLQLMTLSKNHGQSSYFENNNQAVMVTGRLNISDFGMAAAALFNGTDMQPLILASSANGSAGSISKLFSSKTQTLPSSHQGHSRGIAVLVALCAALGTIFLIILLGLILNRIQRRRAGYSTVPSVPYADKHSNINRVPPERLFGSLGQRPGAPMV